MKGEGNQQDYGMRVYDPRLGKFLSVDPLTPKYPELTPYQFASNRPIDANDLDGAEASHWDPVRRQWMMPSDAIRHPVPPGAFMPSAADAKAAGNRVPVEYIVPAATALVVVSAPTVVASSGTAFWRVAGWVSQPQNQMLVGETVTFTAGVLNPSPEDISPGSSSDELGRYARQALRKIPRFAKQLLGTKSQINVPGLSVWEGADAARYLAASNGKAAYMATEEGKGLLILGTNPTRQEVVEEILHHEQHVKYGGDYFLKNRNKLEVEAQDILLQIGKEEKWSQEAMDEIRAAKAAWMKLLENEKK